MIVLHKEKFREGLKELIGDKYDLWVYIDGEFLKGDDAKIPVFNHGLFYGDGVFEGIRAYDGKVFKLDEHLDRLYASMKGISMIDLPITREELKEATLETLRRNNLKEAHIRIIVSRGPGPGGLNPFKCKRPSVYIMSYPFPGILGAEPVSLITSSIRRKSPHSVDAKIKSLNYLDNVLAKIQAIVAGVDDALMLDVRGFVAECTGENIFVVKENKVMTPFTHAALEGITRATIMDMAKEFGYEVYEKDTTIQELYSADEVFLCGSGAEIVPVGEIDGREIGIKQPGPVTEKIRKAYFELVKTKHITPIYG